MLTKVKFSTNVPYKYYNEDEFKKDLLNVNWDETQL